MQGSRQDLEGLEIQNGRVMMGFCLGSVSVLPISHEVAGFHREILCPRASP